MSDRIASVLDWVKRNPEIITANIAEDEARFRAARRARARARRATQPAFRLLNNLRGRIRAALHGARKSRRTKHLIGCSIAELCAHLERQFKPGMTWDNYGQWQVDHIKPCAVFDLRKRQQQAECFHFTNLQPLWAKENRDKRAKYVPVVSKPQPHHCAQS